jgi:hypothetical protein
MTDWGLFVAERDYYLVLTNEHPWEAVDPAVGKVRIYGHRPRLTGHHKAVSFVDIVYLSGAPPGGAGTVGRSIDPSTLSSEIDLPSNDGYGSVIDMTDGDPLHSPSADNSQHYLTDSQVWLRRGISGNQTFTRDPADMLPTWVPSLFTIGSPASSPPDFNAWGVGGAGLDEVLFLIGRVSSGLYAAGSDLSSGVITAASPLTLPASAIDITYFGTFVLHQAGLSVIHTSPLPATLGTTTPAPDLSPYDYAPDLSDPSKVALSSDGLAVYIAAPTTAPNKISTRDSVFRLAIDAPTLALTPLPPWDIPHPFNGGTFKAITAFFNTVSGPPIGNYSPSVPWLRQAQRDDPERVYFPSGTRGGIPTSGQKSQRQGMHGTYW